MLAEDDGIAVGRDAGPVGFVFGFFVVGEFVERTVEEVVFEIIDLFCSGVLAGVSLMEDL